MRGSVKGGLQRKRVVHLLLKLAMLSYKAIGLLGLSNFDLESGLKICTWLWPSKISKLGI